MLRCFFGWNKYTQSRGMSEWTRMKRKMDIGNDEREQAQAYTKFNGIHQKAVHNLMLIVPQTKEWTRATGWRWFWCCCYWCCFCKREVKVFFFRLILVLQFQSLSLTPNSTRILTANPFGNFHKLILHILKVIHCLSNWLSWESNDENNNNKTWSPIAHSHTQSLWCFRCRSYPFDLDDGGDNVFFSFHIQLVIWVCVLVVFPSITIWSLYFFSLSFWQYNFTLLYVVSMPWQGSENHWVK